MSLITLNQVTLNVAGNKLLDAVDWQIQPKERIALVGRNGAGKSSLLKLLQGELTPDSGQLHRLSGIKVAGLTQEVPHADEETVYHFLVKSLGAIGEVLDEFRRLSSANDPTKLAACQLEMDRLHAWDSLPRVDMMATRLSLDPNARMSDLSGGMKRRALLAAALIAAPDLLLLDEPTNHLDINSIEWLESYLKTYNGSLLVVTHDREFLSQVANQIVEIDRGKIYTHQCDYETYLNRREAMRVTEARHNDLFDKRLQEEEAWIRTGIKARRTRNEGRVRALKAMREEYKARREQLGKVKSMALEVSRSGNLVIEAEHVNYAIDDKPLVNDFSLLLTRGDKLGILGPNGCGKTTLVRLLLGELTPQSGKICRGTNLEIAYFDQLRAQLDENQTVMANVSDGSDYVTINGKQKHVATYLREFLFPSERFNQVVHTLSGGERNRLLLAKLFAKPVNLLVLDEPTNDLDIETLELLEQLLIDYKGTLILISHDREFINQVVTSVLVYEGNGQFNEYIGGYEDYRRVQKKPQRPPQPAAPKPEVKETLKAKKLSFNEQRELAQLPQQIEKLEAKIAALQEQMASPDFYQQDTQTITDHSQQLKTDEDLLKQFYERWESLESRG
ncbi:ATP-binding cassette domain-containing protein [Legionella gresilensis]|uniref:ATP-binding cassette domain-containing protein n=1 Tax=Legionella gresilensis TaxID=91823 RepID=UPI001041AC06|nr:ATP-binding cassette domain-containing protein [Legionella gresilensis]